MRTLVYQKAVLVNHPVCLHSLKVISSVTPLYFPAVHGPCVSSVQPQLSLQCLTACPNPSPGWYPQRDRRTPYPNLASAPRVPSQSRAQPPLSRSPGGKQLLIGFLWRLWVGMDVFCTLLSQWIANGQVSTAQESHIEFSCCCRKSLCSILESEMPQIQIVSSKEGENTLFYTVQIKMYTNCTLVSVCHNIIH